jgi:glycosyltransferase involved in cell wall biosynthesis
MLANALEKRENKLHILSFKKQYPRLLYPGKSDKDPTPNQISLQVVYKLDPINPFTWKSSIDYLVKKTPDMVLIQYWTTFWSPAFGYLASRLRKNSIPVTFIIHNVIPHEEKKWDRFFSRMALVHGSYHVVQSKNEYGRLKDLIPTSEPIYHPHPRYSHFTEYRTDRTSARKQLGLDENEFIMLAFGIVRPYKGLIYLLKALAKLKNEEIKPRLVIAGEFWEEVTKYTEFISKLKVADQVVILNRYIPDNEVGILFSAADVYVAPYIRGTQSGAVRIAASFGLPIILSETIADSIELDAERFIIPPKDATALATAVKDSMKIGKKTNLHPGQEYTWDGMAQTIEKILSSNYQSENL